MSNESIMMRKGIPFIGSKQTLNALNKLRIRAAGQSFKLNNSIQKLTTTKPETAEHVLAELRLGNYLAPGAIEYLSATTNAIKSLGYYRKKYGAEGVTKVFERFTKSQPFTNARIVLHDIYAVELKNMGYLK